MVFILIGSLYPGQGTAWDSFTEQVQSFPTFNNPFTPVWTAINLVPDNVSTFVFGTGTQAYPVGCANTSNDRVECLRTDDDAASYIIFNFTGDKNTHVNMAFNVSLSNFIDLPHANVRRWSWTIACRTIPGPDRIPEWFASGGGTLNSYEYGVNTGAVCPIGETFGRAVRDFSSTTGVTDISSILIGSVPYDAQIDIYGNDAKVAISYVALQVAISTEASGCQAPEGAWFPFLDEVACAIGQFAQIVWKGILFVINGLIFIGQIIAWLVGTAFAFFAAIAFFLAIPNAPSYIQAILTGAVVAIFLYISFVVFKNARGSGGGGP